jgi:hypothetical protein
VKLNLSLRKYCSARTVTSVKGIITNNVDFRGKRERVVLDCVIVFVLEDAVPMVAYDGTVVDTRDTFIDVFRAFGKAINLAHRDEVASSEGCVAGEGDLETLTLS